jgi:putative ABC transport system substrate-binding protein
VIGYLNSTAGTDQRFTAAFRQGLSELGYVEGQNVSIEYHWMRGQYDRLAAMAADLVRRQVAVIVATGGTATARAAKSATAIIPIVFLSGGDPVEVGLVASLNRPGGNVTGAAILTTALTAKRVELLHELVPAATSIGFLVNPTNPTVQGQMMEAGAAARVWGGFGPERKHFKEIEAASKSLLRSGSGALTSGDPCGPSTRSPR